MEKLTAEKLLQATKVIIQEKGITQTELAEKSGFTQGNISRMFNASYAPRLDNFIHLLNSAGISLRELEERAQ
jgi:transcriptional regulator with XRE-family HTH domain